MATVRTRLVTAADAFNRSGDEWAATLSRSATGSDGYTLARQLFLAGSKASSALEGLSKDVRRPVQPAPDKVVAACDTLTAVVGLTDKLWGMVWPERDCWISRLRVMEALSTAYNAMEHLSRSWGKDDVETELQPPNPLETNRILAAANAFKRANGTWVGLVDASPVSLLTFLALARTNTGCAYFALVDLSTASKELRFLTESVKSVVAYLKDVALLLNNVWSVTDLDCSTARTETAWAMSIAYAAFAQLADSWGEDAASGS